jgi:hydrogenase maturation protease
MAERAGGVLVAGLGNVLRGDDGFGPEVIWALERSGRLLPAVRTCEAGIGGIGLVIQLLDGYDGLVLVDAVDRGGPPGTLYLLEPAVPSVASLSGLEQRDLSADMHQTLPSRVLMLAQALAVLPARVRLVGCQPAETEALSVGLSPAVQEKVPAAVEMIEALLAEWSVPVAGAASAGG